MKPLMFTILSLFSPDMYCQSAGPEVLSTSGGSGSVNNVSLCWTLGEAIIYEISIPGYTLSQGFHQSQLSVISHSEDLPGEIQILAYPNPVSNSLTISITSPLDPNHWQIDVIDYRGVIIIQKQADQNFPDIDFSSLPSGGYAIRISNQHSYKVFNIIKQ